MIKEFILKYSKEKNLVIDSFMGSGTTGLVATFLNRYFIGTDINLIAYLISNYKLKNLTNEDLEKSNYFLEELDIF